MGTPSSWSPESAGLCERGRTDPCELSRAHKSGELRNCSEHFTTARYHGTEMMLRTGALRGRYAVERG